MFYKMSKFHRLTSFVLEILDTMCVVIICFSIYDIINFEINLALLSGRFPTWPKKLQKFENLQKYKSF